MNLISTHKVRDATRDEHHIVYDVTQELKDTSVMDMKDVAWVLKKEGWRRLGSGVTRTGYQSPCKKFVLKIPDGGSGLFGENPNDAEFRNILYATHLGLEHYVPRAVASIMDSTGLCYVIQEYIDHKEKPPYDVSSRNAREIREHFNRIFDASPLDYGFSFDLHDQNIRYPTKDRPVVIDMGWEVNLWEPFNIKEHVLEV